MRRPWAPALIVAILIAACSGSPGAPASPTSGGASGATSRAPASIPAEASAAATSQPDPTGTTAAEATPGRSARPTDGRLTSEAPSTSGEGTPAAAAPPASAYVLTEYDVPRGSHPHDVAPAPDGSVWYTAQVTGRLGRLDPETGSATEIPLGAGSAPHGVIVGPDGAPWITDGGLNAIVRVDPETDEVTRYELPGRGGANLNTATFDGEGLLWFTGQAGVYGSLDPATTNMSVYDAPRGAGPYGIDATPGGEVWFVSLAGSYLARVDDAASGEVTVFEPPTLDQGARRVWSDSRGRLWISEWEAAQVGMYDPAADEWQEWRLPGANPQPYSVYVDERDLVWLTDFGSNSIVRFDPATETFDSFALPSAGAAVRQQLGREGEIWGAESAVDKLVVLRLGEE